MKASNKIIVMRHAETSWNAPRRRIQGPSYDALIHLSEKGRNETKINLSTIKKPELLICSPLLRCKQTAEAWFGEAFENIPLPIIIMNDLSEINVGKLAGFYVDELSGEEKEIWHQWKNSPHTFQGFPNGEKLNYFQARVLKAFSKICLDYTRDYSHIHIICHGGPMRILRCFLQEKDLSYFWSDEDILNLDRMELTKDQIEKLKNHS